MILLSLCAALMALPLGALSAQDEAEPALPPACTGSVSVETGFSEERLAFDDLTRRYLRYVPETYDASQPAPLILSIHGLASRPAQQAQFARWEDYADEHGFIVVYPQGTGIPSRWNAGENDLVSQEESADDVGFLAALIEAMQADFCIDPAQIYATGLSNGGGMSNRLACELSDTIAAIGTVAGAYNTVPGGCEPSRPVPVISFHGTADTIVPYEGGAFGGLDLPAVNDWVQEWAERNGCALTPKPLTLDAEISDEIQAVRYGECEANAEVVLYTIVEGGHTWPGGLELPAFIVGRTSQTIDATAIMWAFFQNHPMPQMAEAAD